MAGKYILNSLKERFNIEEEEEQEGFPDMNYTIGNSSALDIGEVPTPMSERIGQQTQIGGSVMEVKVANPATFSMKGEDIITTVRDLGIDINLHCDMNVGFASAYKSRGQDGMGFDPAHDYFKRYLQALASFKSEVENRGEGDEPIFKIGRINPHTSTSPMPALSERMAADVGLDPFGFEINKYDEHGRKHRNHKGQNIYKNEEFLRRLYYLLFLEVSNYPFEQYQTFASYSSKFDEQWRKAQHGAANELFKEESEDLEDKLGTILTANRQDQGVGTEWLRILEESELDDSIPTFEIETEEVEGDERPREEYKELSESGSLKNLEEILTSVEGAERLQTLDRAIFNLEDFIPRILLNNFQQFQQRPGIIQQAQEDIEDNNISEITEEIRSGIEKALEALWNGDPDNPEEQNISQDAKWNALQSHLELQNIRIFETAYQIGKEEHNIEKEAEKVFSGKDLDEYFDPDDRGDELDSPEAMHEDMLERILSGQQFEREMWKESVIFYHIMPAWMSTSNEVSSDEHKGWNAPKFIWETLIEKKWGEKEGVNIDLTEPRNGTEGDDYFLDLLENNKQFQMDVAAAVGACYVWGHFTQKENSFSIKGKEDAEGNTLVEEDEQEWTWIEWMNKYGIGVNLEAMAGSPQQMFKVWRHKDIAVAAHAINITARNRLEEEGELGGKEEMHEELDGCPVKFTVDMEHVASLGVDPWQEIEYLVEQEEELAETDWNLNIDSDRPLAKILRQYHLMDPGVEAERGTYHGAFERGNKLLYRWLYNLVDKGFARNAEEAASIMFELAEHKGESSYMMRITMNMIELGIEPEKVDPANVSPGEEYEDEEEALIARFFGIDRASYDKEWAKIEEHAFDPLEGLLEAEKFDYTFSKRAALDNDVRPNQLDQEEYK